MILLTGGSDFVGSITLSYFNQHDINELYKGL